MALKLAISDRVEFPVALRVNDGGVWRTFHFDLVGRRMTQHEMSDLAKNQEEATIREVLLANISNWKRQQLVVDEDGKPAEFSADGLDAMLTVPAAGWQIIAKYIDANSAKEKEKN